jgi:hypothetical protein
VNVEPYNHALAQELHAKGYKVYSKAKGIIRGNKKQREETLKQLKAKEIDLALVDQPLILLD